MICSRAAALCRCWICLIALMLGSSMLGSSLLMGTPADGQSAAPFPERSSSPGAASAIPVAVKSASAISPTDLAGINSFVTSTVTKLVSNDPPAFEHARKMLIDQAINGAPDDMGRSTASAAFLNAYATALNAQLLAQAVNSPSIQTRVETGILCEQVAHLANNMQLAPTAIALVKDSSPAVILWGIKAARWIVPAQLRFPSPNLTLLELIVPAAKEHGKGVIGGAITVEAYNTLTLEINDSKRLKELTAPMFSATVPQVLQLLSFRVGEYRRGIPPEPRADTIATSFLVHSSVWPVVTMPQRVEAMQNMSDLISLAAAQCNGAQGQKLNAGDFNELTVAIDYVSEAMSVAAQKIGLNALVAVLKPLTQVSRQTPVPQIIAFAQAVYPALKASPGFEKATPPPAVISHDAAPPPASAPTTGPVVLPGASPLPAHPETPATPAPAAPTPAPPTTPPTATPPTATPPKATPPARPSARPTNGRRNNSRPGSTSTPPKQ